MTSTAPSTTAPAGTTAPASTALSGVTPAGPGPAGPAPVSASRTLDAEGLRNRVDDALAAFLNRQGRILRAVSPASGDLVESVAALMRGGKRLRPGFCYWGWRGAGGEPADAIVTAAASLELFQAAALIHDDLMDDSDTRRGMPAVHRRFAARHREFGGQGDADRFGLAGSVLAGDMCLVWTDEMFNDSGLDPQQVAAGRPMFNTMRTELLGGQYLDVLAQAVPEPDPAAAIEQARRVIRFKSAKYTIEHPLLIGAHLAGAGPALLDVYSRYGLALGEAFQLRDDVLGVFGDPAETGKPAGDDLREGKRTVLVGLTLQRADPARADLVNRLLGDPALDADGVDTLRGVMVETGAVDAVEQMITQLADEARLALAGAGPLVEAPARDVLTRLITATTQRTM